MGLCERQKDLYGQRRVFGATGEPAGESRMDMSTAVDALPLHDEHDDAANAAGTDVAHEQQLLREVGIIALL